MYKVKGHFRAGFNVKPLKQIKVLWKPLKYTSVYFRFDAYSHIAKECASFEQMSVYLNSGCYVLVEMIWKCSKECVLYRFSRGVGSCLHRRHFRLS